MGITKKMQMDEHSRSCMVCGELRDRLPGSCVVNGCEVCAECWKESTVWAGRDKICRNCEEQFEEALEKD